MQKLKTPDLLCVMNTQVFWPKLSGKKLLRFNFLIQLFNYLYLDICLLYYKGILTFIFEHIMVHEMFM